MPQVGDTIWIFNINRRVYQRDEKGRAFGGPIWREHWGPDQITGETSRSWLTKWGNKIPKNGKADGVAFSEIEIDQAAYVNDKAHRVARAVQSLSCYDTLKRVEAALAEGGIT